MASIYLLVIIALIKGRARFHAAFDGKLNLRNLPFNALKRDWRRASKAIRERFSGDRRIAPVKPLSRFFE